ncbi:MAG: hypothetical protein V3V92_02250 [Candidatus Hydrothermarchaeales archaeon]
MEFDVEYLAHVFNLVAGVAIVILASITAKRLRGSTLYWASILFLATGLVFAAHTGVEIAGLDGGVYAVTALVVTLLLAFTLVIIDITTQTLGEKV